MKLIIEIDKETYKDIKKGKVYSSFRDVPQESVLAIANGTPIPDNATNGDIVQMMFPNADIEVHNITVFVIFDMRSNVIAFDLEWWNSPYQKGGKE